MNTYFAAIIGQVVYGVGPTPTQAINDAHLFTTPHTDFQVVPCTEQAYSYLNEFGFERNKLVVMSDSVSMLAESLTQ